MKGIASSRYSTKNSLSIGTKHDGIRVVGRSHKNSKVWVENDPQKGRRVKRNLLSIQFPFTYHAYDSDPSTDSPTYRKLGI